MIKRVWEVFQSKSIFFAGLTNADSDESVLQLHFGSYAPTAMENTRHHRKVRKSQSTLNVHGVEKCCKHFIIKLSLLQVNETEIWLK